MKQITYKLLNVITQPCKYNFMAYSVALWKGTAHCKEKKLQYNEGFGLE